jgi:hypothetical protein
VNTRLKTMLVGALLVGALALLVPSAVSATSLRDDPVVYAQGDWSVRKAHDPLGETMGSCTGLYRARFDIRLTTLHGLVIDLTRHGRYAIRLDEALVSPSGDLKPIVFNGPDLDRLMSARRLRVYVSLRAWDEEVEDLNLDGFADAFAAVKACP